MTTNTLSLASAAKAALELFQAQPPNRYMLASRWARLCDAHAHRVEPVDRWLDLGPAFARRHGTLLMALDRQNRVLAVAMTPHEGVGPDWRDTYCVRVAP